MTAYHRQKGSTFERMIADFLKANGFPFADRRVKSGAKDKGDIGGVHVHGQRVVIEAKNYGGRLMPGPWLKEAQIEAENDGAQIGVVVAKRRGTTKPEDQFVLMEMRDFVFLLGGMIEVAPEVLQTPSEA